MIKSPAISVQLIMCFTQTPLCGSEIRLCALKDRKTTFLNTKAPLFRGQRSRHELDTGSQTPRKLGIGIKVALIGSRGIAVTHGHTCPPWALDTEELCHVRDFPWSCPSSPLTARRQSYILGATTRVILDAITRVMLNAITRVILYAITRVISAPSLRCSVNVPLWTEMLAALVISSSPAPLPDSLDLLSPSTLHDYKQAGH